MTAGYRIALVVVVLLCGCRVGPSIQNFGPATGPFGQSTTIHDRHGDKLVGELLAVSDSAAVLLTLDQRIVVAHYESVRSIKVSGLRRCSPCIRHDGLVLEWFRREAALRSRWPQGMSEEMLADVLDHYHLEEAEYW